MSKFKVDETKDKEEVGSNPETCPYCGSKDVVFNGPDIEGDTVLYEYDCPNCKNSFDEYYKIIFDSQWGYPLKKKTKK